jgi:coenzyme F420 hydrogenase subunit beta
MKIKIVKKESLCIDCGVCELEKNSDVFGDECALSTLTNESAETNWYHDRSIDKMNQTYLDSNVSVGYSTSASVRGVASSGGIGAEFATYYLEENLVDAILDRASGSDGGEYRIRTRTTTSVNGSSIYHSASINKCLDYLVDKKFRIGVFVLPCMVTAVRKYMEGVNLSDKLIFVAAPFCGHLKRKKHLGDLVNESGLSIDSLKSFNYRSKVSGQPASQYQFMGQSNKGLKKFVKMDQSILGDWGVGLNIEKACLTCGDSFGQEADISFGDAWHQPYVNDSKGTSVVITRSIQTQRVLERLEHLEQIKISKGSATDIVQSQLPGIMNKTIGFSARHEYYKSLGLIYLRQPDVNHVSNKKQNEKYITRLRLDSLFQNKKKIKFYLSLLSYYLKYYKFRTFVKKVIIGKIV